LPYSSISLSISRRPPHPRRRSLLHPHRPRHHPTHAFLDEIILTAFLIFGIFAITEQYNEQHNEQAPGANSSALMIGFLVAVIGASMGNLEAGAISPARDLGPRHFAFAAGWRSSAMPSPNNYWWSPIAGPLLGGIVGGAAYQFLIHPFLPALRRALDAHRAEVLSSQS
jgi:glycerol uptake facilitator protein